MAKVLSMHVPNHVMEACVLVLMNHSSSMSVYNMLLYILFLLLIYCQLPRISSLQFLSYFPIFIIFFTLKVVLGYNPDNLKRNTTFLHCYLFYLFFFSRNLSSYLLVTMATISEQDYNCVLGDLECLTTKFMALEQENQRLLRDFQ